MVDTKKELCNICEGHAWGHKELPSNEAKPLHTCPFAFEIFGNDELCNCCGECEKMCALET